MLRPVLHNLEYQSRLETAGCFVMPFLGAEEIAVLLSLAESLSVPEDHLFYSSSFMDDVDRKKRLNEAIYAVVGDKLRNLFGGTKFLGGNFLFKLPGQNGTMPIHQDWTVVDETRYRSITLWIPLVDTGFDNGGIQYIPGSHTQRGYLRAPSIPAAGDGIAGSLQKSLVTVPVNKGEAFVFDHALMHASTPNTNGKVRPVLTLGLTHEDAQMKMYYLNGSRTEVDEYAMPDDMFLKYNEIRTTPRLGEKINTIPYVPPTLSVADIIRTPLTDRKMQPLFKDKDNQTFFEQNGYLKVSALGAEEIAELLRFYKTSGFRDEKGYGFHVGMDHPEKDLVSLMMEKIISAVKPRLSHLLEEHQVFTASYVVKNPNPKGIVPPHQDWTFVEDEEKHCSVTCWIPLQDVDMHNGCMGVIKGSARFFSSVRPSPSPEVPTPLAKHLFTIFPYIQLLEMKAGEALFFDNRTIHASPPNLSGMPRVAVGLGFTQKDAQIRHLTLKPGTDNVLLKYEADQAFFKKYDNASLSQMYRENKAIEGYRLLEEVPYTWDDLSADEFVQKMREAGNEPNPGLGPVLEQLATAFGYSTPTAEPGLEDSPEEPEMLAEVATPEKKTFWQVYTPLNIAREIKYRVTGR